MIPALVLVCVVLVVALVVQWNTLDDVRMELTEAEGELAIERGMNSDLRENRLRAIDEERDAKAAVRVQSRARLAEARRWKRRALAAGWKRGGDRG